MHAHPTILATSEHKVFIQEDDLLIQEELANKDGGAE
jgi:hypothetical protein